MPRQWIFIALYMVLVACVFASFAWYAKHTPITDNTTAPLSERSD